MDPMSLAAAAAAAVGGYLTRTASSAAEHAADKAGGKLVQLVSDRLQASREGRTALLELQDRPADTARRDAVAGVLSGELTRSPKFAESVAKLVAATQHPAITRGDGNVVSTGSLDNRRGAIATGGSRIDQSRHFRISSGIAGWVTALAVVATLGSAAVVVTENSGPEFPDLEGDWSGSNLGGTRFALHVADDEFTFELLGAAANFRCSGVVTENDDASYRLGTKEGVCGAITITDREDDRIEWHFATGSGGVLTHD
jgi:hypothetical protein